MDESFPEDDPVDVIDNVEVKKQPAIRYRGGSQPCPICSMIVSNSYNLSLHIRRHTNNKPFKCHICSAAFAVRYELRSHAVVHCKLRPFICRICRKDFKDIRTLRTHFRVHGFKEHKCKYCVEKFKTKDERFQHEATSHNKDIHFKCNYCYKSFANSKCWEEHESVVHNRVIENKLRKSNPREKIVRRIRQLKEDNFKYYACAKCSDRFKFKKDQIAHYQMFHMEEFHKIFEYCKLCGKLLTKRHMASHLEAHAGILPFKCSYCDYHTNRKTDLTDHLLTHTKNYRYKCMYCDSPFRTHARALLCEKRHVGIKHVKCIKCDMTFYTNGELEVHENSKHKNRKCQFCDFETDERSKYYRHSQMHKKLLNQGKKKFTCSKCGESFAYYNKLKSHYFKIHGDKSLVSRWVKRHVCSYCDFKGTSKADVLNHCANYHPDKIHQCNICSYSTLNQNLFRNHMVCHSNICKEDFYLINEPSKIFGFSNNSLVLECFICGFVSFEQEVMRKHAAVHNVTLGKFPWYSSSHNDESLSISFTQRGRKKRGRRIKTISS